LVVRRGPALAALRSLRAETGASAVFWNRRYEPAVRQRDTKLKMALRADGVEVRTFNASLLFEPWTVRTKAEKPFQVFTPFWKACLASTAPAPPLAVPRRLHGPARWPESVDLDALDLQPAVDWASGLRETWHPGESGAQQQLERFVDAALLHYPNGRDRPAMALTSRLSPHLRFGEIGPRQVWQAVNASAFAEKLSGLLRGAEVYLRQLGWREFAYHLLFHFPHTAELPLRPEFQHFPWDEDERSLRAWQRGRTGYPIVDAGMRELWATGWMHNRVRMVAPSFLVKDLLLPWQSGAAWFWDTLVDADLANNTLGWQWTAGCGADAAPYFRIFNPISQGEKFDPAGEYVKRWVPELAGLPAQWIHKPWQAPPSVLAAAEVAIGRTYPAPIIDHAAARRRALAALASIKKGSR
jgi:deoxyribodipyrimidine photo-lyase